MESEVYKRIILNSVRHGLIVVNREGLVTVINRAAQAILPRLSFSLNKHIRELGLCSDMEKALIGGITGLTYLRKQSQLNCADDCSVHLSWDVAPLTADNGDIDGAILLFENITDTLFASRQLKEWDRLAVAGEIAAGLAHEMRNPLAAAQGALQLLELAGSETPKQELYNVFSQQLNRINKILADYLGMFQYPEQVTQNLVDLKAIVNEISFLIRREALLCNVELIVTPCRQEIPQVAVDSGSIKQVFLSIAMNALEAMPDGGSLVVSLGWDESCVWVEFKDNGPGIPPENKDNIFKPFFTTKVGGTGLGLAISQRIVKSLDGEIKVLSVLGSGTVVTVYLPTGR